MNFTIDDLRELVAEQAINLYLLARDNRDLRNQMAAMQSAFEGAHRDPNLRVSDLIQEMEEPE